MSDALKAGVIALLFAVIVLLVGGDLNFPILYYVVWISLKMDGQNRGL